MTKPTEQQVIDCDDEQQLSEWAAIYCMGLTESFSFPDVWVDGHLHIEKREYNPCSNKEQAFDLMVKFDAYPMPTSFESPYLFFISFRGIPPFDKDIILKAITKAAICSAIRKEKSDEALRECRNSRTL